MSDIIESEHGILISLRMASICLDTDATCLVPHYTTNYNTAAVV